jgi:hypothetical protein
LTASLPMLKRDVGKRRSTVRMLVILISGTVFLSLYRRVWRYRLVSARSR